MYHLRESKAYWLFYYYLKNNCAETIIGKTKPGELDFYSSARFYLDAKNYFGMLKHFSGS